MIKNQELGKQLLEMMNTAIEASEEMLFYLKNEQLQKFQEVLEGLYLMIKSINGIASELKDEESALSLPAASESIIVSIARIQGHANNNLEKAIHKIEFELLPLIEEMRVNFFFWGTVYPDVEKMQKYYEEDIHWLAGNKYITEAEYTGNYKYDLSITVTGYNKIEYTKQCIAGLLKNLPKNISYEIILLNHGSSDETKVFFEKLHPNKQLDIAVNGGGAGAIHRIVEGKYRLAISNDVIVTKNVIENLYRCIDSDEKIAWVVPSTPNVSNLQSIKANYHDMESLNGFVERNNISDPSRWEQRTRLCNPIDITRSSFINRYKPNYRFHSKNCFSFPDDRQSMVCRRNGYKMYLAKDAYCHHFASVTLREDDKTSSERAYMQGRKDFFSVFGLDPWSTGFCYSFGLFEKLKCTKCGEVNILGVNCGMGGNSLKIKEELKEKQKNVNTYLYNITTDKTVLYDLQGVSDKAEYIPDYSVLKNADGKFDYILAEAIEYNHSRLVRDIQLFTKWTKKEGIIIIAVPNALCTEIETVKFDEFKSVEYVPEANNKSWMIINKN